MQTWHIHIEGQVQGVGFRPFVYQLAQQMHINGWVNNDLDGVHIVFNANEQLASDFYNRTIQEAPVLSRIIKHQCQLIQPQLFNQFRIVHSKSKGNTNLLLTPDFGLCGACRQEVLDPNNRRAGYWFTTCTHCGPRYSIIKSLPYDRDRTSMEPFSMCPACETEYQNPLDRRYFSQTNSCESCGVTTKGITLATQAITTSKAEQLQQVLQAWYEGEIVAIKGIGGYLLTCDATNERAIQRLRDRKHRPDKPFAVMYPSVAQIEEDAQLDRLASKALQSVEAPIVLLELLPNKNAKIALEAIAPGLNKIGVMLPYTPLYACLLDQFKRPIIATSGNLSQATILYKDDQAVEELSGIADYILSNNRLIVIPQDDSVIQFAPKTQQKIVLRRSRGLAPTFIQAGLNLKSETVLGVGGMLKSTFSLLHQGNIYISQYLGNLEHYDTQVNFQSTLNHFFKLFNAQPTTILMDVHPEYPSTQFGLTLAEKLEAKVSKVQHHEAHFAAVLGENNLLHSKAPVLGVIWDGTGYGTDQQIWGGEFFDYQNYAFERITHFDYFNNIAGDKIAKEPRIAALATCWQLPGYEAILASKFGPTAWKIYHQLLNKTNNLQSSSVGRLFDAVASLLDLKDQQSYEGEAAMQLEAIARAYFEQNGYHFQEHYFQDCQIQPTIPTAILMGGVLHDLVNGRPKPWIAAKFHWSLIKLIGQVADQNHIRHLAFSGGVFQNALLVDLLIVVLQKDYQLYFHQQLAPNDENISFGQLMAYHMQQHYQVAQPKTANYVLSDTR